MPTIEELIQEKKRYGLEPTVSADEIELLKNNMPIQYIMGYVEFLNTRINLEHKVLIPRYETEEMVDLVLKKYIPKASDFKVLDLCCGSGFIGLAIKKNAPWVSVTLSDIDTEAITQTRKNSIVNFGSDECVKIIKSNLFNSITGKFDLIISNPPYLDDKVILKNNNSLIHEPQHALYAPNKGWYYYDLILSQYKKYLKPNGKLILEINPLHSDKWEQIREAKIIKDINGKNRFVIV
ncbi:methyltransferase HemK family [Mycoplasmopsis californica HAZ160_1]|uniref:peptide chain release factor N(5)-glutamine methyltransferase n=1 Tax=Mycoplasmopsis californica HAZ160_1 TaxID=1397850 RepID=A0AAT9F7I5_9BACT|nr:peptide chain release factor N(5)-glutamine methyltransferase [Mycoplasmopsis californica]BAP00842.1 methyltransferase HemK family [Mycoplasmopsis californica HAZ160_1]BBG40698.1 methyltransferase HemK family [Mycoplasmopsis californica]BBG41292.1 methyltransferase HemK family [Mycoplasmopsis californica]BBG41885.1 methyltransferase HemK family [Mycoplasmopsis californica]BBG42478.1 methyltransferase HemK family [Mycoplasmopsis californica]